jgi:tetratricopeptide (TPR) repeat protein
MGRATPAAVDRQLALTREELQTAQLDAGEVAEAEEALGQAVRLGADSAAAWAALGRVRALRAEADGVGCWREVVARDPDHVEARVRLGTALAESGGHDEAGEHLGIALGLAPEHPGAIAGAAALLLRRGDVEAAWRLVARHRGSDPQVALVAARVGRAAGRTRQALRHVDRALGAVGDDRRGRSQLLRARADLLDATGATDAAFACWEGANRATGVRFDAARHQVEVDALIDSTRGRSWPLGPASEADRVALLVGPPRSGAALLERALVGSAVAAAGPASALRDLAAGPGELDRAALRARYLGALPSAGGRRVVDRGPDNLFRLGLVAAMLPGARVIRCVRDRADTAFACFRAGPGGTWSPHGAEAERPWAAELGDIGAWLDQADRLFAHWEAQLPLRFLTVRYEDLAREPAAVVGRVATFLGAPLPDAGPAFVHGRSIGRSRRYAHHLAALGGVTCPR